MKNPVVVALDINNPTDAISLAKKLSPYVGGFKIGPRLSLRAEKSFIKDLSQLGLVFFDHKFFDIPSTTVASVEVAFELGADWVTVHALNGPECLKDLAKLEVNLKKERPSFKILAVTVLTSFSPQTLPPIWIKEDISQSVLRLAEDTFNAGLNSFVCSPEEIKKIKSSIKNAFLVVPGIRPTGSKSSDQKRIATPEDAFKAGASALVIGRPIIEAKDPVLAAKEIFDDWSRLKL